MVDFCVSFRNTTGPSDRSKKRPKKQTGPIKTVVPGPNRCEIFCPLPLAGHGASSFWDLPEPDPEDTPSRGRTWACGSAFYYFELFLNTYNGALPVEDITEFSGDPRYWKPERLRPAHTIYRRRYRRRPPLRISEPYSNSYYITSFTLRDVRFDIMILLNSKAFFSFSPCNHFINK